MFLSITYFPPTMQESFDFLQSKILHGKDGLLVAGFMLMALGLILIVGVRRRRKKRLEALAAGKQWI